MGLLCKMASPADGCYLSVLFPVDCLNCESGVIVGWKDSVSDEFLVVVTVIPFNELDSGTGALEKLSEAGQRRSINSISLLGVWYVDKESKCRRELGDIITQLFASRNKECVVLRKRDSSSRPALYSVYVEGLLRDVHTMLIMYDKPRGGGRHATIDDINSSAIATTSHLKEIIFLLNASQETKNFINASLKCRRVGKQNFDVNLLLIPVLALLRLLIFVSNCVVDVFATAGKFKLREAMLVLSSAAVLQQFSRRMQQMRRLQEYVSGDSDVRSVSNEENTAYKTESPAISPARHSVMISYHNLMFSVLFDVFLGVSIVACLYCSGSTSLIAVEIMKITNTVADALSNLIHWMMGVPAGLKLNKQLAHFLGQFFLYHIFLWKTYLAFMQPYIHTIVWCSILPGVCGLTFLLSVASDICSLLTLHIYCFYVYAARIYSLQVYYLVLLGRHFTGRRWNTHTSELEQVPYKIDQLFISTVLFTILLFLVPTTGLFYCVFVVLRSLVLLLKGVLSCTIRGINHLPGFAVCMAVFKPASLSGGLHLELVHPSANEDMLFLGSVQLKCCSSTLHLNMTTTSLPLNKLFIWPVYTPISQDRLNPGDQQSWGLLTKKLLLGQLIYPWIKKDQ